MDKRKVITIYYLCDDLSFAGGCTGAISASVLTGSE